MLPLRNFTDDSYKVQYAEINHHTKAPICEPPPTTNNTIGKTIPDTVQNLLICFLSVNLDILLILLKRKSPQGGMSLDL